METETRTKFAMAAVDFATVFNSSFSETTMEGYKVKLTAPEGQSTGGGVQALQHITLANEADGSTVVVGTVNNAERSVELRSFDHIASLFQQRYAGRIFPVDRVQYDNLQQRFSTFFQSQSFQVTVSQAPPPKPSATAKGSSVWALGIIAVVLLIIALIYFFFLHQP